MKIIKLSAIVLFLFSLNVSARAPEGLSEDWQFATEGKGSATYINFKTMKIDGPTVSIWEARVIKAENNSTKTLIEYHCKNNQARVLSILLYKDIKFYDMKLSHHTPSAWMHIPPDSYLSDMHEILCNAAKARK
jgi:hypothetical protein